ncbi:hypothetical protein Q4F19_01500 [Sphingomonas sp. BIUV-7]|uniref:Uncharacterized protein n=1 Tax=Sphingomonas natans TaxID=3063330 RepID=A0ABT8Y408_9SPHN|nr:hypothetical protein [Sphingomonas sp. BIUV-7]MDO6413047.1 hypothetical protein [Sphingomonas sp. BIUV-7]
MKDIVCRQHAFVRPGDGFSLMAIPAPKRTNASGVLLLINCSDQDIVSLRDPSRSPRHVREFIYQPERHARLRHDPNDYRILNFNEAPHNNSFEHIAYAKSQDWAGPVCLPRTGADDRGPGVPEGPAYRQLHARYLPKPHIGASGTRTAVNRREWRTNHALTLFARRATDDIAPA